MDGDLWARFAERTALHHVPRSWSRMRFYPEQKNVRLRDTSDEEDALIRSRYLPEEPTGGQVACEPGVRPRSERDDGLSRLGP